MALCDEKAAGFYRSSGMASLVDDKAVVPC